MELAHLNLDINKKCFVFACCIPVKGIQLGAIYDLQRDDIERVPNSLIDFIYNIHSKTIVNIIEEWKNDDIAQEYIEFLIEKEFIFFAYKDHFPNLSDDCFNDDVSKIEFATIIVSDDLIDKMQYISDRIDYLGVKRLHFHFSLNVDIKKIHNVLNSLEKSCVIDLSVSLPYQENFTASVLLKEQRLKSIYFYQSPYLKEDNYGRINLYYLKQDESNLFVPKSSIDTIAINHRAFLTAKKFNLGLYKTILVDHLGRIRLNAVDQKDYGLFLGSKEEIEESLSILSELWRLNRDKINPCKDCELRYACTASFIPEYIPEREGYFVNCNYNIHTNEWIH
ncbi:hypothetical protein B0A69_04970 [Chryseobacterium shigense]|uniref:SPASM domain peptide maturase, grasp-with-spasm system n=1 Tax=Chryseobacterium shigense TaxID=297244 RepID=A0A1N7IN74_9FLAO|nr:hypothetical protein [Chryseobacterium shigense]PQA95726.1 hypothetical protein B0A69_04970 [Chryseobacterium shigense]SIS38553.1 SPASM domain peptide maturase, grasp-with-spasm system [Chryseobacterium shigense]